MYKRWKYKIYHVIKHYFSIEYISYILQYQNMDLSLKRQYVLLIDNEGL